VRNFGRSGRTKWKHLVAEDTTNFESDYIRDEAGRLKTFKRPGPGGADEFSKPKKFKM
jgi:microfibrillar-associated protein 1